MDRNGKAGVGIGFVSLFFHLTFEILKVLEELFFLYRILPLSYNFEIA